MDDFYSPVAEYYDLVARAHSEGDTVLRESLAATELNGEPLLDLGAGTGRTVAATADSVPQCDIMAVERAPTMRTVLMHRVINDPQLRQRVTVVAEPVDQLHLPEKLGAVVAYGVLGHLCREKRQQLWQLLLPLLSAGALIFVELLLLEKPIVLPAFPLACETVGKQHYIASLQGEPWPDDTMLLTSCWTVRGRPCSAQVIRNQSVWHTFSLAELAQEAGLRAERLTAQAGVLYA
ncbi:methyltransferase type 12 [Candidatus Symbiopectobacterium sp. 'North America']|uniref:methyltransferase n=1 Tax=Candidatus Symbiopectobacterium sp. 'North America' TaxID=2794574 RepID=UPI0018C90F73|nr:class I SAM-dependent methyltransferase [Candidatus Symbiopectobacterium sp. 'North America']MBG6245206.1 methyltransferase type 12 [Candidatus Symbiopectobacterium sp. 'North America']